MKTSCLGLFLFFFFLLFKTQAWVRPLEYLLFAFFPLRSVVGCLEAVNCEGELCYSLANLKVQLLEKLI